MEKNIVKFTSGILVVIFALGTTEARAFPAQTVTPVFSAYGSVDESWDAGSDAPQVYFVQDAHDSVEAQKNIAEIIEELVHKHGVTKVFEEGYDGTVPVGRYFNPVAPSARKRAADYYLHQLLIGGAEYVRIFSSRPFELIGAEDAGLYLENLETYQKSVRFQTLIVPDLLRLKQEVRDRLGREADSAQKAYMEEWIGHLEGRIPVPEYARGLIPTLEKGGIVLPPAALRLRALFSGKLRRAPGVREFMADLDAVQDAAEEHLLPAGPLREGWSYFKSLVLFERLSCMELGSAEARAAAVVLRDRPTETVVRWLREGRSRSISFSKAWEVLVSAAVDFYETADRRDGVVIRKLSRLRAGENAALVFGGFHREHLTSLMREAGISYTVITPKFSAIRPEEKVQYRRLMMTPLGRSLPPVVPASANRQPGLFFAAAQGLNLPFPDPDPFRVFFSEVSASTQRSESRQIPENAGLWRDRPGVEIIPARSENPVVHSSGMIDVLVRSGEGWKPTGNVKKKREIHWDGDWHHVGAVLLTHRGKVILLRMQPDHLHGNKYQFGVHGHVDAGETVVYGTSREGAEEVNIPLDEERLLAGGVVRYEEEGPHKNGGINREVVNVYEYELTDEEFENFNPNNREATEAAFVPAEVLREALDSDPDAFTPRLRGFFKRPEGQAALKRLSISLRDLPGVKTIPATPANKRVHSNGKIDVLRKTGKGWKPTKVSKPKDLIHQDGDWHYVGAGLFIVDGKVILMRMKSGHMYEGQYQFTVHGHINSGETVVAGTAREIGEETRIRLAPKELATREAAVYPESRRHKKGWNNEVVTVYVRDLNPGEFRQFRPSLQEATEAALVPIAVLESALATHPEFFTPSLLDFFRRTEGQAVLKRSKLARSEKRNGKGPGAALMPGPSQPAFDGSKQDRKPFWAGMLRRKLLIALRASRSEMRQLAEIFTMGFGCLAGLVATTALRGFLRRPEAAAFPPPQRLPRMNEREFLGFLGLKPHDRVIEVGPGKSGAFGMMLWERGADVEAVDIRPWVERWLLERKQKYLSESSEHGTYRFTPGDYLEQDYGTSSARVIILRNVLDSPDDAFGFKSWMRPAMIMKMIQEVDEGGWLIFSSPFPAVQSAIRHLVLQELGSRGVEYEEWDGGAMPVPDRIPGETFSAIRVTRKKGSPLTRSSFFSRAGLSRAEVPAPAFQNAGRSESRAIDWPQRPERIGRFLPDFQKQLDYLSYQLRVLEGLDDGKTLKVQDGEKISDITFGDWFGAHAELGQISHLRGAVEALIDEDSGSFELSRVWKDPDTGNEVSLHERMNKMVKAVQDTLGLSFKAFHDEKHRKQEVRSVLEEVERNGKPVPRAMLMPYFALFVIDHNGHRGLVKEVERRFAEGHPENGKPAFWRQMRDSMKRFDRLLKQIGEAGVRRVIPALDLFEDSETLQSFKWNVSSEGPEATIKQALTWVEAHKRTILEDLEFNEEQPGDLANLVTALWVGGKLPARTYAEWMASVEAYERDRVKLSPEVFPERSEARGGMDISTAGQVSWAMQEILKREPSLRLVMEAEDLAALSSGQMLELRMILTWDRRIKLWVRGADALSGQSAERLQSLREEFSQNSQILRSAVVPVTSQAAWVQMTKNSRLRPRNGVHTFLYEEGLSGLLPVALLYAVIYRPKQELLRLSQMNPKWRVFGEEFLNSLVVSFRKISEAA